MKEYRFDALVIGGGAAGMSAAQSLLDKNFSVALVEREKELGGILLQCIHNGFGVHEFKEELTGPEYAERWAQMVQPYQVGDGSFQGLAKTQGHAVTQGQPGTVDLKRPQGHPAPQSETGLKGQPGKLNLFLDTTVLDLQHLEDGSFAAGCANPDRGFLQITARVVVLTAGCRERNRGNIKIPGTRPAGVYTAGLAQRMVNMEGMLPGKNAVIVGSGDIGLIMARRLTWSGCKVHGVIEIQPYPSGLTRNIVQCLNDFQIPLYLSHVVTNIRGKHRIEAVEITPLEEGRPNLNKTFVQQCDTLLLSVGLVPSAELAVKAGAELNPITGGPLVDSTLMCSVPGLFAAGNVLHVHDLVDYVSEEAKRAGHQAALYLEGTTPQRQIRVKPGSNVRYLVPGSFNPDAPHKLLFRPMIVKNAAKLTISLDGTIIKEQKKNHVQPSEMVQVSLGTINFDDLPLTKDSVLEVSLL